MESEKIIQDLSRRFAHPLPDFYKRRIIVWYDEDGEFQDQINEIQPENARVVCLNGCNNFEVKKLIAVEDTKSNILLYCPLKFEKPEDNWFADISFYGEEFRADLISMQMEEMDISQTPNMRRVVKEYRRFFAAKERRNKFLALDKKPINPAQMHLSVMAVIAGVKDPTPEKILYSVLSDSLYIEENDIYRDIVSYGAQQAFLSMVQQGTGYYEEQMNLQNLVSHIIIIALTRTIDTAYLNGLEKFYSEPNQSWCYDFVSDWISKHNEEYYNIARDVEQRHHLVDRLLKLSVEELLTTNCIPCVHEVILLKLMEEIEQQIIQISLIKKVAEKRRVCSWYDDVKSYYDGILQTAQIQDFYLKHQEGFHYAEAQRIWKEYTSEYYLMGTYYRLFHKAYAEILKNYNPELQDKFTAVREYVDRIYNNWFLGELGANWTSIAEDELKDYGFIYNVSRQEDFYRTKIKNEKNRIYVVISDALRYETAKALEEQLRKEMQCKVDMETMQAILPTITKFGMAALLPHKELSLSEKLDLLCDGMSTESPNRETVLKAANPKSVALKYKDLIPMNRSQRQALVKDTDVVYIYHNKIDHVSHTDENSVFLACEEAITELKNMVRIITNEFSGSNIYITSDHGFLYTYTQLREDDKLDKSITGGEIAEYGRRYAIAPKGANSEYMINVNMLESDSDYTAFVPRENIRIKMTGAGLHFVHGGASLQEMVVPLIKYSAVRTGSKEFKRNKNRYESKPVTLSLMTSSLKISNLLFSLNFLQNEAVTDMVYTSDKREAMEYTVYFTDSRGVKISDVKRIIADKTDKNPQLRTYRISFSLKNATYNKAETYYLVIADAKENMISQTEFQIDIAFSADEFDFF